MECLPIITVDAFIIREEGNVKRSWTESDILRKMKGDKYQLKLDNLKLHCIWLNERCAIHHTFADSGRSKVLSGKISGMPCPSSICGNQKALKDCVEILYPLVREALVSNTKGHQEENEQEYTERLLKK